MKISGVNSNLGCQSAPTGGSQKKGLDICVIRKSEISSTSGPASLDDNDNTIASRDIENSTPANQENQERLLQQIKTFFGNTLNEEQLIKAEEIIKLNHFSDISVIAALAKMNLNINDYVRANPDVKVKILAGDENSVIFIDSQNTNRSKVFNISEQSFIEEVENIKHGDMMSFSISNRKNNIKHYGEIVNLTYFAKYIYKENILKYSANGDLISKVTKTPSEIDGIYNIYEEDADGRKQILSAGYLDKSTGNKVIEKNLISPGGVITSFNSIETPEGERNTVYRITDDNGNVLFDYSQAFKRLDDNTFLSSSSTGSRHKMEYSESSVNVTDLNTGEVTEIDLEELCKVKNIGKISLDMILPMLKQMSGENLIKIKELGLNGIYYDMLGKPGAFWLKDKNVIEMGNMVKLEPERDKLYPTLMHEFGHFVDSKLSGESENAISDNPEFIKVYEEELANFRSAATSQQISAMEYFIGNVGTSSPRREVVAEAYMLLNSSAPVNYTIDRSNYLQEFFPKTIVTVAKLSGLAN